ncbi:hypothetical protein T02_64 [Trichinella nativa]|uniref:Uncharacterized protein n=1 Tax=Trichinella nativa TaxID=6335 RepID=A0A0V1L520_9BILA|nr:hypothetical protein T02_64 [Trichinella nativa]
MLATTICQLAVDCNLNDLQARSSDRLTAKPMSWSIQAKQSQDETDSILTNDGHKYRNYCTYRFQQPPPRWTKSINPLLVPATPANAQTWLPGREPFGAWLIGPYHRVNKTAPRFFQTVLGSGECSVR